jgi:hypothetical protein
LSQDVDRLKSLIKKIRDEKVKDNESAFENNQEDHKLQELKQVRQQLIDVTSLFFQGEFFEGYK